MLRNIVLSLSFISCVLPLYAQTDYFQSGKQSFVFSGAQAVKEKPIRVWYYSPGNRPDTLPIVIMLHGAERNASAYLDQWIPVAQLNKFVVLAPEFSKDDYGGAARYNLGNVYDQKSNKFTSSSTWTYSVIEPLFEYIKSQINSIYSGYYLSGHSAGAQFVHRFLYFVPDNRALRVMMANAGWYTMPDYTIDFPLGLRNSPIGKEALFSAYEKKVLVILGEADTDTTSTNFQKGPEYNKQGLNRFERGQTFFNVSAKRAKELNTPFHWKLITLPGVAHSNAETAIAAGALFKMNFQ